MDYEQNDFNNADIAALVDQFERYLKTNDYSYFDEEGLEMLLEYYEARNLPDREEAVIDLARRPRIPAPRPPPRTWT